jgi:hypothetical protein
VRPPVFSDRSRQRNKRALPSRAEEERLARHRFRAECRLHLRQPALQQENFKIPGAAIEKREKLSAIAGRYGVDLRTAARQFSSAADVAVALVVGARSADPEDYNSLGTKIPSDFWAELKQQGLIEPNASIPANPEA